MTDRHSDLLVNFIEECFSKYGDTHAGMGWPKPEHFRDRYRVMLDVIRGVPPGKLTLLDYGCGTGNLLEFLQLSPLAETVKYSGIDLSPRVLERAQAKFPAATFRCIDITQPGADIEPYDYVVSNGVFTSKFALAQQDMWASFASQVTRLWQLTRHGLAFNVMSKHVDWERDDLFHVPFDEMGAFVRKNLSSNYVFRADYGLYEYTVYVYRSPIA
jgi:SAM-dependent methyltransferase